MLIVPSMLGIKPLGKQRIEECLVTLIDSKELMRLYSITMGTKIKRRDETVQEVNPQELELFDGLINLAFVCSSSQSGNSRRLQLKDVLCFEL